MLPKLPLDPLVLEEDKKLHATSLLEETKLWIFWKEELRSKNMNLRNQISQIKVASDLVFKNILI